MVKNRCEICKKLFVTKYFLDKHFWITHLYLKKELFDKEFI